MQLPQFTAQRKLLWLLLVALGSTYPNRTEALLFTPEDVCREWGIYSRNYGFALRTVQVLQNYYPMPKTKKNIIICDTLLKR